MYSLEKHGHFITDTIRVDAYANALAAAVCAESVVVDIGTGVGLFAILSCKLGAKKVYAIESDNIIEFAKENALRAGVADRIEFIRDNSSRVTIAERADVIVSDLRGVLPLYGTHLSSIIDARKRFLSASGRLIPQSDSLWVSLVDAPDLYRDNLAAWENEICGIGFDAGRQHEVNSWWKVRLDRSQLLVEPRPWSTIDYATVKEAGVRGELTCSVTRNGTVHGLGVWFDTALGSDIGFSNSPDAQETVYGQAFFPLIRPIAVEMGDAIKVSLQAKLLGDEYVWRWRIVITGAAGHEKANYDQNSLSSQLLTTDDLRKASSEHTPILNRTGSAEQFALSLMDGTRSLSDVARQLSESFPDVYPTMEDAINRVGQLSQRFST